MELANGLQAREAQLANVPPTTGAKNWPPLPAKCCIGPCFYQDITVEIPDPYQKTVQIMYYIWISYAVLLLLNVFGALAICIANPDCYTFFISVVIFLLSIPLSYLCWFRPVYKAFRSDSSFSFMVFFCIFFFHIVVCVFYAVGPPRSGSCGLFNGISTLSTTHETISTYTVGIIVIIIGLLWAVHAMVSFYMLIKINRIYRGTGASFAKAQEELASGVMTNQHAQNAATTAAHQRFNSASSGLRYEI